MSENYKYDDKEKGGYSYGEKLALVAQGLMDPKQIGLPPGDVGQKHAIEEILGKKRVPKLGDFVTFEASVVPIELRAHWAYQDLKVRPQGITAKEWEIKWIEDNKDTYLIQSSIHSGTCHAQMQQTFRDPIIGFATVMKEAAILLEKKYEQLKESDPNPIITRRDQEEQASGASEAIAAAEGDQQAS